MLLRRLKDVSLIQVLVKTSLQLVQLVSLIQEPIVTSRKDVSNRSVLLTYQLRRRNNISALASTFNLLIRISQFILGTRKQIFAASQVVQSLQVPAITSLQRLKDVSLIQVPALTSLRCVKLISLTQVSIGTSLRRLKLVGLNQVLMRRHKDVSNRSVSFTYQSRRCNDVSAWSATSRPI